MMTWEETIHYIRTQPEFADLVELAYFDPDLSLNVKRFKRGEEYKETKRLMAAKVPFKASTHLLEIGGGNGIAAVSFAKDGMTVDVVEPDPSDTVGSGAILKLKKQHKLHNLRVHSGVGEKLDFADDSFDVVYARQCLHHADDLPKFMTELYRVLKHGGLLFTVRDHVIYDEADKANFLAAHPLQKYYGGENAFTLQEYTSAIADAGFKDISYLAHYDSVLNYFPMPAKEKRRQEASGTTLDERSVPGRMYSFMATK